jgi:homoserine dehydrogenase
MAMKLLLIGFGHVGQELAGIMILNKSEYPGLRNFDPVISQIISPTRGSISDPSHEDIRRIIGGHNPKQRTGYSDLADFKDFAVRKIRESNYDVLVELSPLSISENGDPAVTYVREALMRGKHVVTANKGPVAFAHEELHDLALKNGAKFLFESTVMDGAPVFNMTRETLKGCRIHQISGILNSTTTFILSSLEQGASFDEAVREAQGAGFTESDPANDIEGWDAAAKITVLANALLDARMTPFDVRRRGIRDITQDMVREALENKSHIRLVARARNESGRVTATVGPEKIPEHHHFSGIRGTGACLRIETDLMTPLMITQESPTLSDTAFGVIGDLLTISQFLKP